MRKVTIRQSLIDDGYAGGVACVAGTEVSPVRNRQPQEFEVARRDCPQRQRDLVARFWRLPVALRFRLCAGQLLPVSGTPQAKAACCTPGSADTRSKARRWKSDQFPCTAVTLMVRICPVL